MPDLGNVIDCFEGFFDHPRHHTILLAVEGIVVVTGYSTLLSMGLYFMTNPLAAPLVKAAQHASCPTGYLIDASDFFANFHMIYFPVSLLIFNVLRTLVELKWNIYPSTAALLINVANSVRSLFLSITQRICGCGEAYRPARETPPSHSIQQEILYRVGSSITYTIIYYAVMSIGMMMSDIKQTGCLKAYEIFGAALSAILFALLLIAQMGGLAIQKIYGLKSLYKDGLFVRVFNPCRQPAGADNLFSALQRMAGRFFQPRQPEVQSPLLPERTLGNAY